MLRSSKKLYSMLILLAIVIMSGLVIFSGVSAQDSRPTSYTVERGDTLDIIAQKLNVSLLAIQQAAGKRLMLRDSAERKAS